MFFLSESILFVSFINSIQQITKVNAGYHRQNSKKTKCLKKMTKLCVVNLHMCIPFIANACESVSIYVCVCVCIGSVEISF